MTHRGPAILAILLALLVRTVWAQESAPVTVDASPSAAELLRRAQETAAANPTEAARLTQEAMERFGRKLVPWPPVADRFRSAETAANELLRTTPAVMAQWLREQAPIAERQLADGMLREILATRLLTPSAIQAGCLLAQRAMDEGRPSEAMVWIDRTLGHPSIDPSTRDSLQRVRDALATNSSSVSEVAPAPSAPAASVGGWQPLWSVDLPGAWLTRRMSEQDPRQLQRMREGLIADGQALVCSPRLHGDAVLLADGVAVQAIDRFSGSVLWSTSLSSAPDRTSGPIGDLCEAVPAGDLVITLPGHALPDQRSGPARVVAVDRRTGRRVWDFRLDLSSRPEFEDLFPHGEPLVVGDLVVVQARKSNARLESAAWLLALERSSGTLRWSLSLGAAGGVRLAASRPLGSPAQLDGDIVAASSLGVVARIDAATGDIRWLRRWPPPVREPRVSWPAWQLPSPVVDEQSIVWIEPDGATLTALDPVDGSTRWSLPIGPGTEIGVVRALCMDRERVFAVGDDLVAIDRSLPTHVVWRLSAASTPAAPIRGQVVLGSLADGTRAMVVPTQARVVLLDPASGRELGGLALQDGANACLQRGQLVAAGATSLQLAMPAEQGERLLRERLAERPDDPRRALALVELGRAWHRGGLMIDGARAADAALADGQDPVQQQVRSELIDRLVDRTCLKDLPPSEVESVIGLARALARTPTQQALVLLCEGDEAAARRQDQTAADAWIRVLADPALAVALVDAEPTRQVMAGTLATRRLMASPSGRVAGWQHAMRLIGQPTDDPARLLASLHMVAPFADSPERLEELERVVTSSPALRSAPEIGEALQKILHASPQAPMPRIGLLQPRAVVLPGVLAMQTDVALQECPRSAVLLLEPSALVLRRTPDFAPVWRVPMPERDPLVASWSPALSVWVQPSRDDASLLSIDAATGAVRFRVDQVARLFSPSAQAPAASTDPVDRSDLRAIECIRSGPRLIVVRADGQMVAIRIDGDGRPEWTAAAGGPLLTASDGNDWSVVTVTAGDRNVAPDTPCIVAVRRAGTGQPWLQGDWPAALGVPRWIRVCPDGLLLAGERGVALASLLPELPLRWLQSDRRLQQAEVVRFCARWVILKDRGSDMIVALDLGDGSLKAPFLSLPSDSPTDPIAAVDQVGDLLVTLRTGRVAMHGMDGTLRGTDAVASEHRYDAMKAASNRLIVTDFGDREAQLAEGQPPSLALRQFDLSQGLRNLAPPQEIRLDGARAQSLHCIDDWVLVACDDRTIAVQAPVDPPVKEGR